MILIGSCRHLKPSWTVHQSLEIIVLKAIVIAVEADWG